MKKLLALALVIVLLFSVAACGKTEPKKTSTPESVELNVFAAQSLTDVLDQIIADYTADNPNVVITVNYNGSGTLQTQIEEGAECDIFISAAQKQMNALEAASLIAADTRVDLLINKLVMVAPVNSALGLAAFEDAAGDAVVTIAIGDPESVPAGQYTEAAFTTLEMWDVISKKATLAENVRAVLALVESESVDCGFVYATDAAATDQVTVVCEAPEGSHDPVIYPAALTASTEKADAAKAFLDYLKTAEAVALFEAAGFTMA